MNGSCVTIDESQCVKTFLAYNADSFGEIKYKTVNIYSLSLTSWDCIVKKLDQHISDGKVNDYYETVFAEMIADGSLSLKIISFDGKPWYEIDTIEDLAKAERLFLLDNSTSMENIVFPKTNFFDHQLINAGATPGKTTGILNAAR